MSFLVVASLASVEVYNLNILIAISINEGTEIENLCTTNDSYMFYSLSLFFIICFLHW